MYFAAIFFIYIHKKIFFKEFCKKSYKT